MSNRWRVWDSWLTATTLVAMSVVGCNAVTGVFDLRYHDPPGQGGAAMGGGGVGATSSGLSGGAGGVGGAGGKPCRPAGEIGTMLWSRSFGASSVQTAEAVSIGSQDRIVVAGDFVDTLDLGLGNAMTEFSGFANVFLFELDAGGMPLWQLELGDPVSQHLRGLAHTTTNELYVIGDIDGSLSQGPYTITTAGQLDAWVGRLQSDKSADWHERFGDGAPQQATAVTVDGSDNGIFVGKFSGAFDLGVSPLSGTGSNAFVAKVTDFATVTAVQFGLTGPDNVPHDVAVGPDNSIVVVGGFDGPVDFGDGDVRMPTGSDAFVVKLQGNLMTTWSRTFGEAAPQSASAVAVNDDGTVAVAGSFANAITIDTELTAVDVRDAFVALLDSDGNALWSLRLGGIGNQDIADVAIGPSGDLFVAGSTEGDLELCGQLLEHSAGVDMFVVRLDASGQPLAMQRFGLAGDDEVTSMAFDALGNLVIVGRFAGELAFGATMHTATDIDIFVVKMLPTP